MDQDPTVYDEHEAHMKWDRARRRAFMQRVYSSLGLIKQPLDLLSFQDVQAKLRLNQSSYRGLQQVPLDQIVGSVGRYHDFTRSFLPLVEGDSGRWRRIAALQAQAGGLPPVELYRVGDAYFVKDGNHRVSVANQFGAKAIEAYVWEYETQVGGLSATGDIDELIVKAEYRAFLDRTRLDIMRPEQNIVLTEPGRYPDLELEIELFRTNLEQIDEEERSYEDAATAWYDLVYTITNDVIEESNVLDFFPGRTAGDLYAWTSRHRRELREKYGDKVSLHEAVTRFIEDRPRPLVGRVVQSVASSVAGLVQSLTPERGEGEDEELWLRPAKDEPLGKLLTQIDDFVPLMAYQKQRGDDWRQWRYDLRQKVWELLGLTYEHADHIDVEIGETALVSCVNRTRIWLTAADGLSLPGYIMRPCDVDRALPALLVYPGHGTIRQTASLEPSTTHANALALAQTGYVTITLEERGFGELNQVDHIALDNLARIVGRTWLGLTIDDGLRALDYLVSRPDVQSDRLGVTGVGLGGGLALFTAALDERVRAVVIEDYIGADVAPANRLEHGCDFVPSLRRYVELSDVARLIVPRPALYAYPEGRRTTKYAHRFFDKMRPSYEMFSCPDRTRFIEHQRDDSYAQSGARDWFDRWLVEEDDTSVLLWAPRE
ncbi:MAG: acetylxylan esterase [Anaerolineae bacterium]|nr:acetylxylan esterase [Anaerolineae bacterium]